MKFGNSQRVELNGQTYSGFKLEVAYPHKQAVIRMPLASELNKYDSKALKAAKDEDALRQLTFDLYKTIFVAGDELDEWEAASVIPRITQVTFMDCTKEDDRYSIIINTPFGVVSHTMRPPSYKEMSILETSKSILDGYSKISTLYDALYIETEGYNEAFTIADIPVSHKSVVVQAIVMDHRSIDPLKISFSDDQIKND
jgi:hypothetical protein